MPSVTSSPLVVFSPMPPLRNGIADYSAALLEKFSERYVCIVVIEDASPLPTLQDGIIVLSETDYAVRRSLYESCVHLFHIGNNKDSIYLLKYIDTPRSIIVLHDLSLFHMYEYGVAIGRLSDDEFLRLHVSHRASAGHSLHSALRHRGGKSIQNYLEMSLITDMLQRCSAAITHSVTGYLRIKGERPGLDVRMIPHFADVERSDRAVRRETARTALDIEQDCFVCLSVGFITRAKCLPQAIEAFFEVCASKPNSLFLIVGELLEVDLLDYIASKALKDRVRLVGYVPEREIERYMDACDLLVNLRSPSFGETSGSLIRALGRGVCAVISDSGWYQELPANIAFKIDAGTPDRTVLASIMLLIASDHHLKRRIEETAFDYSQAHLALDVVASQYLTLIEDVAAKDQVDRKGGARRLQGSETIARLASFYRSAETLAFADYWIGSEMLPANDGAPVSVYAPEEMTQWLDHALGVGQGACQAWYGFILARNIRSDLSSCLRHLRANCVARPTAFLCIQGTQDEFIAPGGIIEALSSFGLWCLSSKTSWGVFGGENTFQHLLLLEAA